MIYAVSRDAADWSPVTTLAQLEYQPLRLWIIGQRSETGARAIPYFISRVIFVTMRSCRRRPERRSYPLQVAVEALAAWSL